MKQLTALKTATFPCSFSILSSKMCSSGNGTRSVRRSGKYRSIRHMKISESQTGNFGRMERAQSQFPFGTGNFWGGKSEQYICMSFSLEHVSVNKFRSTDFYRLLKERIHVLRLRKILIFEQAVANSKMRK